MSEESKSVYLSVESSVVQSEENNLSQIHAITRSCNHTSIWNFSQMGELHSLRYIQVFTQVQLCT